jgi:hypothetical protein
MLSTLINGTFYLEYMVEGPQSKSAKRCQLIQIDYKMIPRSTSRNKLRYQVLKALPFPIIKLARTLAIQVIQYLTSHCLSPTISTQERNLIRIWRT